jgi:glycosyltransferase involved in cell wall biosynthesis
MSLERVPVRIAIVTEIPAPFRNPLFAELSARSDVDLLVLFLSERDPRRHYQLVETEMEYEWRVLPRRLTIQRGLRWVVVNRGTFGALRRFRPDAVVVGGWNQPSFWIAALYARLRRCALMIWVESTTRDARSRSSLIQLARRAMVAAADGALVPGEAARSYVLGFGIPTDRVAIAPNAIDLSRFEGGLRAARTARDEIRARLGVEGVVVLSVGRYSWEKGHDVLVRAAAGHSWIVVCVGEGPERQALEALAGPNVRIEGYADFDALVDWYTAADIFVLPSRSDTWGMVLNEAAAAGLPLVASAVAGAAYDLIEDGVNGFRVSPEDPAALAEAISRLADDRDFRTAAGARTLELAESLTPARWAESTSALAGALARVRGKGN